MKKKIGVVLLCIVMFCLGCAVTGLSWSNYTTELEERNAQLEVHVDTMEAMLQDNQDRIAELTTEITEHEMNLLKLKTYYGIDIEELLGE